MAGKQNRGAIDVGHEITDILQQWSPDMNSDDVSSAIIHALIRLSINVGGSSESKLLVTLHELSKKIDEQVRSI